MLEKGIDAIGKSSIVAIPVSEAAKVMGFAINVDTFQCISAIGVLVMVADKIIRYIWDRQDRKARVKDEE